MLRGVSGVAAQYEEILRHSEGGDSKAGDGLPNVWEKSRIKKTGFFRVCVMIPVQFLLVMNADHIVQLIVSE